MAFSLRNLKRFPPRASIDFLSRPQRKAHRDTISVLSSLTMALESGAPLTNDQERQVSMLTRSDAIDTRINTMTAMLEQTEGAYLTKLAAMAPYDLSAYHELMNPGEPPAHHHYYLCDYLMKVEAGELATLIVALPPGAAKALTLDTPVPTPNGWTTMGALSVGDEVFDENGQICRVTWKSPVWKDRPVYDVRTDTGDVIRADELHEWKARLCRKGGYGIHETKDIARSRSKRASVEHAKALSLPEVTLPIDPYLLGVWLGDGTSASGSITSGDEDRAWMRAEIERLGYKTTDRKARFLFGVSNIRGALVKLKLLHDPAHNTYGCKHIPLTYLRASATQRLHLLQGLIDSDGSVREDGYTVFSNTNKLLAEQVVELVRSLGVKTRLRESTAKLHDKVIGKYYRVGFYLRDCARLPRKRERTRDNTRTPLVYIDATYAGIADTVCIEVDSPSHLFLAGRSMTPTHNSTYASRTFVQWYMGRNPDHRVLAVGHSQKFTEDEFSKPNRNAVDTDTYRLVFPDVELNPMEQGASFWKLNNWRGSYACRGALAGTSGLRAKIIMADDLFKNAADAMSPVVRENIWRWWTADVMSRRLPGAPIVLVNCLTGDSPVLMADGSWKPIKDLRVGDDLTTYHDGQVSIQKVERWAEQEEDDVIEVHTGNGSVKCNARHPFWAMRYRYKGKWEAPCWIKAGELKVYDKVCLVGKKSTPDDAPRLEEDSAWLLGCAYGDGCVSRSYGRAPWKLEQLYTRVSVSRNQEDRRKVLDAFKRVFNIDARLVENAVNSGVSTTVETNVLEVGRWFIDHGISPGKTAHTKRVPQWLFNQPENVRRSFIDGFIFADGHVTKSGSINITLCNEELIRDIGQLMRGLGYRTTTIKKYTQYSFIPGIPDRRLSVRYRITASLTTDQAFYFKGVTKIVDLKRKEKLYDIQVSNTHNFIADNVVVSNTLWHSEDVPNRIKKLAEDDPESIPQPFKFINIPAQAEEDDPLGRAPGEWLWCSDQQEDGFYSIKDYETKRATMPPSLWSALYLGQPLDKLGDYISEDQFVRYDRPPVNRNGHQIEWTKTIMSIDCAARGADRSDYTAILIFRKHVDGSHYLVDAWRGKETLEKVVRIISKLMRFWQVNYAVLEDSGMGIQILDNYQGKLPAPLIAYTPSGKGSKDFRFDAAAPWITAGKVLFPKQGPWIVDFINELVAFPNSANDDWVDAFSMYTDHELKARVGGTKPLKMRP